ncbi:MAG: segregation and condensation protein A [Gammaproteobacteria bacterium]|nr:segregation and condensation protein A [Gammaproteobacteria bacterium]MDH3560471.1 segregation and condensation protein A [Gammaproteobacteria bacterium]
MADLKPGKEERILRIMKRVLTDIAKDTYTRPGYRHPLSDDTVKGIRDCLSLITAREAELAQAGGRPMNMRPRFVDEPQTSVVVNLDPSGRKGKKSDDS